MEKVKRFIINRGSIDFLKSILESYEDIGIISVIDGKNGLIEIIYSVFFENHLLAILKEMKEKGIYFTEVDYVQP